MSQNARMTAPRPQNMQRILGADNGHALWLEQTPIMTLTNPSKFQCMSGKDHLLSPLPTAAELAAALAPDNEKAALERGLVQPLRDFEVDFEALVGPKRKSLQSAGPLWCGGMLLSCAAPPVIGTHLSFHSACHAFSQTDRLASALRARRYRLLRLVHCAHVRNNSLRQPHQEESAGRCYSASGCLRCRRCRAQLRD